LAIAECFEGFAALASVAGRPRRAARLYGAAEAIRETTGAKLLDPADRRERDRHIDGLRRRLGVQSFETEWAAGRKMAPDEIARLALRIDAGPGTGVDPMEHSLSTSGRRSGLTRREREVAALVARGMTNRQVAGQLFVAPRTIETHLEHIFAKLSVQTRAEVAAWAARQDTLEAPATMSEL
jgi:DNA-binding CsgD family transcriptional regulator